MSRYSSVWKVFVVVWLVVAGLLLHGSASLALARARSRTAGVSRLEHIIVVILENHAYSTVRTQPYTKSLLARGTEFTNSFAITHPSQPNYIAFFSGSTQGVSSNTCPAPGSPFNKENLGHACEAAGLTWRAYSENLDKPGSTTCSLDGGSYTRKHDPWTQFGNLNHQNERPYSDLAKDIAAGNLPNLAFVVPNNCNNSHDCSVSHADTWLASNVPAMLKALGPDGMLVLTWDEDDDSAGNHILTAFVGAPVKAGFQATQKVTHYTILRAICESLGLTPFASAASQNSIDNVWQGPSPVAARSWGNVKTLYR
jgi:phosphatidylinositol-3-phosphatase